MKKSIVVLLICLPLLSLSQIGVGNDSLFSGSLFLSADSGSVVFGNGYQKEDLGVSDTIPVVMILSDTSGIVKKCNGYEVRLKKCCVNGYSGNYAVYQPIPYYEHVKYLNGFEKELPKYVEVWMSKSQPQ